MSHWSKVARTWSLITPPLRPSAEDIALVRSEIDTWSQGRALDLLVLGVTPELVSIPLPAGSTVVAVDREPAMIEMLFSPAPGRRAVVGDWRELPLPASSIDVAVGDGCASLFAFPDELRAFFGDLARVVKPSGTVALRLFASPEIPESLDDVRAALQSIGSFAVLKWRIAMAILSPARSTPVTAVLDAFNSIAPDREALATSTGWSREVIDQIDTYRGSTAVYSYPTLSDVRTITSPWFTESTCHVPRYELGHCCPTLVLRRVLDS